MDLQYLKAKVLFHYHFLPTWFTTSGLWRFFFFFTLTDGQYSYYAKNVEGCLSSEIICVEHDILIGLRVNPVFQNTHLKKAIRRINWKAASQLTSFLL